MKPIYLIITVFAGLIFSQGISGQTDAKNKAPEKAEKTGWTIIVTDKLTPKKEDKAKKQAETKKINQTAENKVEKTTSPAETEKNGSAIKPEETALNNQPKTTDQVQSQEEKTEDEKLRNGAANPKPAKLSAWEKTWSILAVYSSSFDTNLENDPEGEKAFGFVPSVTAGFEMRSSNQRWQFIYSSAVPRYTMETDLNRFGNYFAASYRYSIKKWSFETLGEVSLKGTNEDRETNDQYVFTETIGYRFDKKTRLYVFGAYRVRRYPEEDADRNAVNPMLGFKFSRRLTKKIDWALGYRYDENRSLNPRQNYIRLTYKTGVEARLTKNDLLQTEITYRPRRYKNRLVDVGDEEFLRRDKKWILDLIWTHNFTPHWGIEARYQFEKQNSNDTDKIFQNHQIVFSFFYHWGNGDVIAP